MSVAELPIVLDREKIAEFCRARGIRKLSLFGSVLREDFDPARSDVDVLVLGSVPLVMNLGTEFMPELDEGDFLSPRGPDHHHHQL
mgnify:CR=1 FL=1